MNERDTPAQHEPSVRSNPGEQRGSGRGDDRRAEVNPVDKPVPRSPEPEHEAVREGEEKLERVKPY